MSFVVESITFVSFCSLKFENSSAELWQFSEVFGNVFIENSISDFKIRVMINDIPGMLIKWLGIGGLETFLWVSDLL